MAILGLLGVQAALFSPSKYGILPEILPHEKLSSGNGLMEMWTNLAIIGGTVAGGIIRLPSRERGPGWGAAARGRLGDGADRGARDSAGSGRTSGGGLAETLRLGWSAIRADRILRLAIWARSSSGRSPAWSPRRSWLTR